MKGYGIRRDGFRKKTVYIVIEGFTTGFRMRAVCNLSGIIAGIFGFRKVKAGTARQQKNRTKQKCRCLLKK